MLHKKGNLSANRVSIVLLFEGASEAFTLGTQETVVFEMDHGSLRCQVSGAGLDSILPSLLRDSVSSGVEDRLLCGHGVIPAGV